MAYTRSAIVEASIAAAKEWLSAEYAKYSGSKLPIYMAASVDGFRQIKRVQVKDGSADVDETTKEITPFAIWAIGSISVDAEKAGFRTNRANNGVVLGADRFKGSAITRTVRPVKLGIGCAFISSDIDQVLLFAETLFSNIPKITLVIRDEETGFETETSLLFEGDLTIPQPDSELGGTYRFETALSITSETGIITEQRLIRKLRVSVQDVHSSTALQRSNVTPGVVFEGSADELLSTVVNYYDLFNKDSHHYKYDYTQEVK